MRLFGIVVFMYSVNLLAYPIILKITNKCNNPLFIQSSIDYKITISSGQTLELLVFSSDGWSVQYASGLAGKWDWNFNEPLSDHIAGCKSWYRTPNVFYVCDLQFEDHERGYFAKNYVMRTNGVWGEEQQISTNTAETVLKSYYDNVLGIAVAEAPPSLRKTLSAEERKLRTEFFGEIQRLTLDAHNNVTTLVRHSKMLAALFPKPVTWEPVALDTEVTPGEPATASSGIAALFVAALWNLIPGK